MNGSNLFGRIVKAAVVSLYAFFFIGAVVLITGCGEEREDILQPALPTINLRAQDIYPSYRQFAYAITASEPLPYPITLRVNTTADVFANGHFQIVRNRDILHFKRGSQTVYGFYNGYFLQAFLNQNSFFCDKEFGTLECVRSGAGGSVPDSPRGAHPVIQITVMISHLRPNDDHCVGLAGGAYTIESSKLTLRAPDDLIETLFPDPDTRPWEVR